MGRSQKTIKQYIYIIKKFFDDTNLSYTAMTGQDVMDYLAIRQYRDKISKSTASIIQKYLSAFAGWAYRKHHIDIDIARDIDHLKAPQAQKKRLSDYVVAKMRTNVKDSRSRALLEVMLSAGPRVTEICNLRLEDLDFTNGVINIYGEKSSKWRTCFMTESCKVALQEYIGERKEGFLITHKEMGRMLYITDCELIKWRFKDINHILLGVNYDKDLIDRDNTGKANHVFRGHLSIDTACDFVKANYSDSLQNVIMCHLSAENADSGSFVEKMKKVARGANVDVTERNKEWVLRKGDECPF